MSMSQLCAAAQCRGCLRLKNAFVNVSTHVLIVVSLLLISAATTFGATLVVPAGGDLQSAINSASPGDTIVVEAGATYRGPFTLTAKGGDAYITIQSSRASEIPGRVSPSQSELLAKLRSNVVAEAVIQTATGAHHYKLIGLDISTVAATDFVYDLIRLGNSDQTDLASVPHHLILDRVWVHGFETQEVQRGISLNTAETSIINSYISDIHAVATDTQAIGGWNGPGPYHIINNHLEAAGENIMFGGSDPKIQNLVPSDIEIRRNRFFKPLTWKVGDPSYLGRHWAIKNHLELKNARRVTIDGNIFQNNWVDAQNGIPIVFTARNQDGNAPWSVVENVTFTNNTLTNTQGGVNILKTSPESKGAITSRITIANNLFNHMGTFDAFTLLNGPNDVEIIHNTVFKNGNALTMDADSGTPKGTGLVIRDNLFSEGGYGVFGSGIGEGTPGLDGYFSSYVFAKNNVAGRESFMYPSGTSVVLTPQVGFVDFANGNYRLASGSPFKNAATDGKDVGVDMDALLAAQNGTTQVPSPTPTPTPVPTPTATPTPNPTPTPTPNPTPTPTPNPTPTPTPNPTPTPTPTQTGAVQFNAATYSVNENAGLITITVTRTGSTAGSATVSYSTADVSAVTGSDYNGTSGTLSFAAGETSKSFTVRILDDTVSESNETFRIALSGPSNVSAGSPTTAAVTIVDNDKTRGGRKTPRGGVTLSRKAIDF